MRDHNDDGAPMLGVLVALAMSAAIVIVACLVVWVVLVLVTP